MSAEYQGCLGEFSHCFRSSSELRERFPIRTDLKAVSDSFNPFQASRLSEVSVNPNSRHIYIYIYN